MSERPELESAIRRARVLVVGDSMLDRYWFGAVDRISPEAPVPVVRVNREQERPGGAANVALNVRALGASVTLLSVVGADEAGTRLGRLLESEGVTTVFGTDSAVGTIVKLRVIGRSQQLIRVDFENAPDHEVLMQLLGEYERILPSHGAVLLSDYGKGGLTHISRMIELARARDIPVFVDPKGRDYARYRGANLITPNRAELGAVIGEWSSEMDLESKAHALRVDLGLDGVLLTRSEEGMSLFDGQGHLHVPTRAREVFDVTGAGDTVIATIAAMAAGGISIRDSVEWANRAAGIVVGKFGTATVSSKELFS